MVTETVAEPSLWLRVSCDYYVVGLCFYDIVDVGTQLCGLCSDEDTDPVCVRRLCPR